MTHCVDDMIVVETQKHVMSGWRGWKRLNIATGWDISDEKTPLPCTAFPVIGVVLNLSCRSPALNIAPTRIVALQWLLDQILQVSALGSGQAASLASKLSFALCACFGKYGRAKLRPILRRCYEERSNLNEQLVSCLVWWKTWLGSYVPRTAPLLIGSLKRVVSYSDGEGDAAGVGVCLYGSGLKLPLAAYVKVPMALRDAWRTHSASSRPNDIFLIEAIGPLVLLCTFPNVFKNALWLHFIDNTASQYALVRGSSSILSGDHVVGLTWAKAAHLGAFPYFDRVHTKSNPIDGVSRGDFSGPWGRVYRGVLPLEEITALLS